MGPKTPLNAPYYQALALTLAGVLAPNTWGAESSEPPSVRSTMGI